MENNTDRMHENRTVLVTVNGRRYERSVPPRELLSDFLRHSLGLTGTHEGCEHGVCGACTVLLDGEAVRSCLIFAVQADRRSVETVEEPTVTKARLRHQARGLRRRGSGGLRIREITI